MGIFSSVSVCWIDSSTHGVLPPHQRALERFCSLSFSHLSMLQFVFIFFWLGLIFMIYSWSKSWRQKCRLCQTHVIVIIVWVVGAGILLVPQYWSILSFVRMMFPWFYFIFVLSNKSISVPKWQFKSLHYLCPWLNNMMKLLLSAHLSRGHAGNLHI